MTKTKKPRFKRLPKGPNGGIQLLLIQSVKDLGRHGDLVEVKLGFAFNYLIPQGLATIATDHHQRMVEKHKSKLQELEDLRLKDLKELASQLAEQSVTIEANANEEGHLYGSVGAKEITTALKQNNLTISPDQVRLDGPLRELALYTVKIQLHEDIEAALKVWVVQGAGDEDTSGS